MAIVERNVIRIALYELKYSEGVPVNVVLNEAIELAKRYGTSQGAAFTNGLLDRAVGELGIRRLRHPGRILRGRHVLHEVRSFRRVPGNAARGGGRDGDDLVTVAATRPLTPPLGPGLIALQLAGCLAAAATAWSRVRSGAELKRVAFSESSLRVLNFRREIIVPVSDVDVVDQHETQSGRVVIRLTRDTEFGRRIIFSPMGLGFPLVRIRSSQSFARL